MPRHTIIKLLKANDKEKISQAVKENDVPHIEEQTYMQKQNYKIIFIN